MGTTVRKKQPGHDEPDTPPVLGVEPRARLPSHNGDDPRPRKSSWMVAAPRLIIGLVALGVIGAVDYLTGYEISFSVFYLLPVGFLSWKGGRGPGLFGAAAAAVVWLVVEFVSSHNYSQHWIPYWNAVVRLVFFVVAVLMISQQKRLYTLEQRLASCDGLSGLMNARSFFQEGERVRALCARHARPLTMLYLDLDNFKQVNDRRGHQEGDSLIRLVGSALRQAVRSSDLAARLGGDEFGLLLPETGIEETKRFMARLYQCLDKEVDRSYWLIGYSIGVVTFPTPPEDMESATAEADRLMYEVKNGGKNRWVHRVAGAGADPG